MSVRDDHTRIDVRVTGMSEDPQRFLACQLSSGPSDDNLRRIYTIWPNSRTSGVAGSGREYILPGTLNAWLQTRFNRTLTTSSRRLTVSRVKTLIAIN